MNDLKEPLLTMRRKSKLLKIGSLTFRVLAIALCSALACLGALPSPLLSQDWNSNEYRIGVEDVLNIHVWHEDSISKVVPVRNDGKISLPLLDDIHAAGKTPLELKQYITERLKEFIDDPIVTVIVSEQNNFKVYVSGQVRTPGMHRLRSKGTLLQVIPLSGGFTEWANEKKIVLIRTSDGKEEKKIINYKKLLDTGSDFELRPGDVIVVP
jgi:polysaccharide export outer membrane protein